MITFIGDFVCKLDAKGRFVLPSLFKKTMNEVEEDRFVIRKDLFENCLILYPYSEWELELNRIRSRINPYNREHNRFFRDFFKGSAEVSFDSNGRVLVPKRLLEMLDGDNFSEMVLLGVDKKIEMWSREVYDANQIDQVQLGDLAEKIFGGDLMFGEEGSIK